MKKRVVATALVMLLGHASTAAAQDWMSWSSKSEQQPAAVIATSEPGSELATLQPPAAQSAPSPSAIDGIGPAPLRDNGMIGNPTPALALYVAQVEFAHENCGLEATKQNERFYEWAVKRGLMLAEYRKKDGYFSQAEKIFLEGFQSGWIPLDEDGRKRFCSSYAEDVGWAKDRSRLGILNVSDRFRSHFAPLSQERIDRARKASIFAGVLSLGFTAAGINQVNQHDFATARQFNNYGAAFAHLINDPSAISQTPCESYLPFLLANVRPEEIAFDAYYSIRDCAITRSGV